MLVALVLSLSVFSRPVYAQATKDVTMTLDPKTQTVIKGNDVAVKVMLSASTAKKVSYAKALFKFDANLLEIKDVTSSNMFCQHPTDISSYAADNTQGVLMVTGFSNGTTECPHPELTLTPVLFVTVTFKTKSNGVSNLQFEYTGTNDQQSSSVMDINSPTQFILIQPENGTITINNASVPTTTVPAPPENLGIESDIMAILAAAGFLAVGVVVFRRKNSPRMGRIQVRE